MLGLSAVYLQCSKCLEQDAEPGHGENVILGYFRCGLMECVTG